MCREAINCRVEYFEPSYTQRCDTPESPRYFYVEPLLRYLAVPLVRDVERSELFGVRGRLSHQPPVRANYRFGDSASDTREVKNFHP